MHSKNWMHHFQNQKKVWKLCNVSVLYLSLHLIIFLLLLCLSGSIVPSFLPQQAAVFVLGADSPLIPSGPRFITYTLLLLDISHFLYCLMNVPFSVRVCYLILNYVLPELWSTSSVKAASSFLQLPNFSVEQYGQKNLSAPMLPPLRTGRLTQEMDRSRINLCLQYNNWHNTMQKLYNQIG